MCVVFVLCFTSSRLLCSSPNSRDGQLHLLAARCCGHHVGDVVQFVRNHLVLGAHAVFDLGDAIDVAHLESEAGGSVCERLE